MARRTFIRVFWILTLAFAAVLPMLYYLVLMPVSPQNMDPSLFERGIGTPILLWLNGYLGTYFNYRFLGAVAWMALPVALWALTQWRKLDPWQRGLVVFHFLALGVIGGMGGFNYRYALTLLPLSVLAVWLVLWKAFVHYDISLLKRGVMLCTLAILCVLNTALGLHHRKQVWAATPNFSSPDTEEGTLSERLDTSPRDLEGFFEVHGVAATETVLVNNLPVYYYRTARPGFYYWCGSDQLFSVGSSAFLFHDRTDAQAARYLLDSLHCSYVFSTYELTAYSARFKSFLEHQATLLGEENRGHTLHRINAPRPAMSARKFKLDLGVNALAFALSALLGVLVNVVIVRSYDAAALGVFNQVYAVYILLSQLAVGGVHLAVQAFVPARIAEGRSADASLTAAVVISTVSSLVVMAVAWLLRDLPGRWFGSQGVAEAFASVIPGLLFFSWNKVLLSYHNGARRMKLFALFQFLRFAILLVLLMRLALAGADPTELPAMLAWTEGLLFALLLPVTLWWWSPRRAQGLRSELRSAFRFGNLALPGNLLLDMNTRVDVFLLGLFTVDAQVGLYSFAATVAEGAMQLPVLFRNAINPVLGGAWHRGGAPLVGRVVHRNRRVFLKVLAPVVLLSILLFPAAMWVLGVKEEPRTVWAIYAILALGIAITSGHQPFQMLFGQLGRPDVQTLFITGICLSNVLFNLIFIPLFGLYGSALGTALSMLVMWWLMDRLARRTFGIHI